MLRLLRRLVFQLFKSERISKTLPHQPSFLFPPLALFCKDALLSAAASVSVCASAVANNNNSTSPSYTAGGGANEKSKNSNIVLSISDNDLNKSLRLAAHTSSQHTTQTHTINNNNNESSTIAPLRRAIKDKTIPLPLFGAFYHQILRRSKYSNHFSSLANSRLAATLITALPAIENKTATFKWLIFPEFFSPINVAAGALSIKLLRRAMGSPAVWKKITVPSACLTFGALEATLLDGWNCEIADRVHTLLGTLDKISIRPARDGLTMPNHIIHNEESTASLLSLNLSNASHSMCASRSENASSLSESDACSSLHLHTANGAQRSLAQDWADLRHVEKLLKECRNLIRKLKAPEDLVHELKELARLSPTNSKQNENTNWDALMLGAHFRGNIEKVWLAIRNAWCSQFTPALWHAAQVAQIDFTRLRVSVLIQLNRSADYSFSISTHTHTPNMQRCDDGGACVSPRCVSSRVSSNLGHHPLLSSAAPAVSRSPFRATHETDTNVQRDAACVDDFLNDDSCGVEVGSGCSRDGENRDAGGDRDGISSSSSPWIGLRDDRLEAMDKWLCDKRSSNLACARGEISIGLKLDYSELITGGYFCSGHPMTFLQLKNGSVEDDHELAGPKVVCLPSHSSTLRLRRPGLFIRPEINVIGLVNLMAPGGLVCSLMETPVRHNLEYHLDPLVADLEWRNRTLTQLTDLAFKMRDLIAGGEETDLDWRLEGLILSSEGCSSSNTSSSWAKVPHSERHAGLSNRWNSESSTTLESLLEDDSQQQQSAMNGVGSRSGSQNLWNGSSSSSRRSKLEFSVPETGVSRDLILGEFGRPNSVCLLNANPVCASRGYAAMFKDFVTGLQNC